MSHSFRVWSAGCSTGEEPYTIAMSLLDSALEARGIRSEVLGTDVSTQALDRAQGGGLPRQGAREPSAERRSRAGSSRLPAGIGPSSSVRDIVDFSYHNLIKEPYPSCLLGELGRHLLPQRHDLLPARVDATRRQQLLRVAQPGRLPLRRPLRDAHFDLRPVRARRDRWRLPVSQAPSASAASPSMSVLAARFASGRRRRAADGLARRDAAAAGRSRIAPHRPRRGRRAAAARSGLRQPRASPSCVSRGLSAARRGQARARPGRWPTARSSQDPESVDALIVRALHACRRRRPGLGDRGGTQGPRDRSAAAPAPLHPRPHLPAAGRPGRGARTFKRTIYIDRDFVLAHFNLANLYTRARCARRRVPRVREHAARAVQASPDGAWTAFLGGFRTDLLAKTCERSLIECRKGIKSLAKGARSKGR